MQSNSVRDSPDIPSPGVVELREDVPLKAGERGGGVRWCAGGPRFILACFAALTAAITLALLTQIYYGDYEVVPHGSVASDGAACSAAGTDALKAGGRALDAAAAAALCLAITAPHVTSLDASGSMLHWEYRQSRTQQPSLVEWGGPDGVGGASSDASRPPRLVASLAALHARLGTLPWARVLQPAIDLARNGFLVSEGLAESERVAGLEAAGASGAAADVETAGAAGTRRTAPLLADYLQSLQANTSTELSSAWSEWIPRSVREGGAEALSAAGGGWRAWAGGAGARALPALSAAFSLAPLHDADKAVLSAMSAMGSASAEDAPAAGGVATGLAVVDSQDNYLALVTGLSAPFGSGEAAAAGWRRDLPRAPLDLAPAILAEDRVCGTRYVVGAGSAAALAQAGAALPVLGAPAAVERPRAARAPANLVQQRGDALLSHADSRGGGVGSRF